jgi:hypothetical protein
VGLVILLAMNAVRGGSTDRSGSGFLMRPWYPPALLRVISLPALNWFGAWLDGTLARVRNRRLTTRPTPGFFNGIGKRPGQFQPAFSLDQEVDFGS